jgi:hypothetical protein
MEKPHPPSLLNYPQFMEQVIAELNRCSEAGQLTISSLTRRIRGYVGRCAYCGYGTVVIQGDTESDKEAKARLWTLSLKHTCKPGG